MIYLRFTVISVALFTSSFISSCQKPNSENQALTPAEIVQQHRENQVLLDVILIYIDNYGNAPDELSDLIEMYATGINSYGFDEEGIKAYIQDPFSSEGGNYGYFKNSNGDFLLYSIGPDGKDDNLSMSTLDQFDQFDSVENSGDILIYLFKANEVKQAR